MIHFLDIGSNIGNTFDWYLLKTTDYDNCHIWCFEPSPRHLDHLRVRCRSIIDHNEHSFKITICSFALSNFTGFAKIFETADSLGDSLFETSVERPVELMCGVVDAAKFIREEIPAPDRVVLKIDPEGSELNIIDSILAAPDVLSRVHKVMIEFHSITHPECERIFERLREASIPFQEWKL